MEKSRGIFISYSWTNVEHEEWVLELATRLRENGVDVKLDKWDLKEGQDVYTFMESMVNSQDIEKVLVICEKGYKEKAEQRKGGVGTETQIITPEIYNDVTQEKFIPIIAERGVNGETFIPTYMKTRKYIDLSSEDTYEKGFESLLRNIFERPQYTKPGLGIPPTWLFEDDAPHYTTRNIIKQIDDAMQRVPTRVNGLSKKFIDSFFECLSQFHIKEFDKDIPVDETITSRINSMLPLRNDYISYLEKICEFHDEIDVDFIIGFFERLYSFTQPLEDMKSWNDYQFDHFKFLTQEIFIYTFAILVHYSQYKTAGDLLRSEFFVKQELRSELQHENYSIFRYYIRSLEEHRKNRLKLNRLSLVADLLVQRAEITKYPQNRLVDADIMLYYLHFINEKEAYFPWFPNTYIYGRHRKIELLQRLVSRRFFNKVRFLFGISEPEELKKKFKEFKNEYSRGYQNSFERIPDLRHHINPDEICSLP